MRERLRYLLVRARRLNPSALVGYARRVHAVSRRPTALIVADMLWCSLRYEAAFQDYLDWDFHELTAAERRTFMTHPISNHLVERYNPKELRHTFRDKIQFDTAFSAFIGRDWLDVRTASTDAVRAFTERHGRVMAKPAIGIGGAGIRSFRASEVDDWEAFRAELLENRQTLLEEFIEQHAEMAALCPTSVNTLRLITFHDGGRTTLLAAVLKAGNGGDVDNFSGGGMYTMLDDEGVAAYPAFDAAGRSFAVHPLTGIPIVGFRVPRFAEAVALVGEAAAVDPRMPYIGWDVAIGVERPLIIEGNPNTGVFQTKPSVSGVKTGLKPAYRAAMRF